MKKYVKIKEAIKELAKIRNPQVPITEEIVKELQEKISSQAKEEKNTSPFIKETLLTKKAFFELTTARNRNLINPDEQNKLRKTVIAFFGLSVGSHAAVTWMMESRADEIKIIDPDTISLSNLNRLRSGVESVEKYKVDEIKSQLESINPFASIYAYKDTGESILTNIIDSSPKVDVIVDEIDSFQDKIILRKLAKERKLPLVSAADVGDNIILDVERYDNDEKVKPFLGRIGDVEHIKFDSLSDNEKRKLIIQLVGFEKNSERMIDSLFAIGAFIPTWPQLGATATISGGVITTTIKKIILGEHIKSGRYYISLDDILVSDFNSFRVKRTRNKKIAHIKKLMKES